MESSTSEKDSAVLYLKNVNRLRKQGNCFDLTLRFDENSIKVHEIKLFSGTMPKEDIAFKVINYAYLNVLIEYETSGILNIDSSNVIDVLLLAVWLPVSGAEELCLDFIKKDLNLENCEDYFLAAEANDISKVKDICIDFIGKNLNADNWIKYFKLAKERQIKGIIQAAIQTAADNFYQVFTKNEFLELDFENFLELVIKLSAVGQDQLYVFITRWIKEDSENRQQFLKDLYDLVNPALVSPSYLRFSDFHSNPDFSDWALYRRSETVFDDVGRYILVSDIQNKIPPSVINIISKTPTDELPVLPYNINSGSYVCNGYYIYHQGGVDAMGQYMNSFIYHQANRRWEQFIGVKSSRKHTSSCVFNGRIYSVGGAYKHNALPTVEYFDLDTGSSAFVESLPNAMSNVGITVHENAMYVLSGLGEKYVQDKIQVTFFEDLYRHDPRVGGWDRLAGLSLSVPHQERRSKFVIENYSSCNHKSTCAVLGKNIYAGVGFLLQRYDIRANEWEIVPAQKDEGPQEVFAVNNQLFGLYNRGIAVFKFDEGVWETYLGLQKDMSRMQVSTDLLIK